MNAIFKSKRKENIKKIENKLTFLVDRKERKEGVIDDHGRDIVMNLRDYLNDQKGGMKYKALMKEAKRYIQRNQYH